MELDKEKFLKKLEILDKFRVDSFGKFVLCNFNATKILNKYPFFKIENNLFFDKLIVHTYYVVNGVVNNSGRISIYKDNDDYYYISVVINNTSIKYKLDQLSELMYFLNVIFKEDKINEDFNNKLNKYISPQGEERVDFSKCVKEFNTFYLDKLKKFNYKIYTASGHMVLSITNEIYSVEIHQYEDDYFFACLYNKKSGKYINYKLFYNTYERKSLLD